MNSDASRHHGAELAHWLPLSATSPMAKPGDAYQARSGYSAGLILSIREFGQWSYEAADVPCDWLRERIGEAKRLRPCFLGDFHPLMPCIINPAAWMAYQLLVPETQEGAVLAFSRSESPVAAVSLQLGGLDAVPKVAFRGHRVSRLPCGAPPGAGSPQQQHLALLAVGGRFQHVDVGPTGLP